MAGQPPSLRFLFAHPAHFIACGCGSGLSQWAPGTVGTVFAWLTFLLFRPHFNDLQLGIGFAIAYVIGFWAIDRAGRVLGDPDHGSIVWDEIVPFWIVLLCAPGSLLWQTTAFALFRFFDIVKPQPAKYFDQHVKNGFGVMADDAIAGAYTLLVLAGLKFLLG